AANGEGGIAAEAENAPSLDRSAAPMELACYDQTTRSIENARRIKSKVLDNNIRVQFEHRCSSAQGHGAGTRNQGAGAQDERAVEEAKFGTRCDIQLARICAPSQAHFANPDIEQARVVKGGSRGGVAREGGNTGARGLAECPGVVEHRILR